MRLLELHADSVCEHVSILCFTTRFVMNVEQCCGSCI